MVENLLLRDLRKYLGSRLKIETPLQGVGGVCTKNDEPLRRTPKIINGYLPPKRSNPDDDFPFVLVRPDSGKTVFDATTVDVSILVGCFSDGFDGHEDCLNVMAKIRQAIYDLPNATLNDKYEFRGEFSWQLPEQQQWPYWAVEIQTSWLLIAPQFSLDKSLTIGEF